MAIRPTLRHKQSLAETGDTATLEDAGAANTNPTLDNAGQEEQALRTGQVAQGDDELIPRIARRFGWRPKEELDRVPNNWLDAKDYLERTPDQLTPERFEELRAQKRALEERLRRSAQAAADAIEDSRRQARIEAQAEIRAAAEAQDPERAELAAKRLAEIPSGPPPQTVAWIGKNPWFETDPLARDFATSIVNARAKAGASIDDQLDAAESEVRKRFPEHFPAEKRQERTEERPSEGGRSTEVRLSESRRVQAAPAVAEGARGGGGAPKEKGFNDIPAGDRALYQQKLARKFEGRGKTPEEAKAIYAKAYWRELGE